MEIGILSKVQMSKNINRCNKDLKLSPKTIEIANNQWKCPDPKVTSTTITTKTIGSRWDTKTLKNTRGTPREGRCSLSIIGMMMECLEWLVKKMIHPTWIIDLRFKIINKVVRRIWNCIRPKTPYYSILANSMKSSNSSSPSHSNPNNKRLITRLMCSLRLYHLEEVDNLEAFPRTSITTRQWIKVHSCTMLKKKVHLETVLTVEEGRGTSR